MLHFNVWADKTNRMSDMSGGNFKKSVPGIHFSCQSVHLIINVSVTMVFKKNSCRPVYHCVEKFVLFSKM